MDIIRRLAIIVVAGLAPLAFVTPAQTAGGSLDFTALRAAGQTLDDVVSDIPLDDGGVTPLPPYPPSPDPAFDDAPLRSAPLFDDFNGPEGSPPDPSVWQIDTINQGGIQVYTQLPENVSLDGEGHLRLRAIRKADGTWTSGHITTRQRWNFGYGRISARIFAPRGQGFNNAFWMLGTGWRDGGEIDIQELPNRQGPTNFPYDPDRRYWHHLEFRQLSLGLPVVQLESTGFAPSSLYNSWHEYWCERSPQRIRMGVDDQTYADWTPADSPQGDNYWPFDRPFYQIINLAVGDNFSLAPDATTPSPADMLIDWFRYTPA
jgi:beta-glucanase (GH16 family)